MHIVGDAVVAVVVETAVEEQHEVIVNKIAHFGSYAKIGLAGTTIAEVQAGERCSEIPFTYFKGLFPLWLHVKIQLSTA